MSGSPAAKTIRRIRPLEQTLSTVSHANNFDCIRILAALAVLVSHQYALTGLPEPAVLGVHSLGGFGVLVFFSLSGYLVARSWSADPSLWRFAARRLLRIWPALAVAILLSTFVLGPAVSELPWRDYLRHPQLRAYLGNLLFQSVGTLPLRFDGNALPHPVNGSLWTIPIELQCYALLATLGVAGLLRNRWWLIGLTLLLMAPYFVLEVRGNDLVDRLGWTLEQRFAFEFGLFFAAGAILSGLRIDGRRGLAVLAACWVAAPVALLAGRPGLALWLVLPATVVILGARSTPLVRSVGRYGDLSYGLYIYAFPVQQTLIWIFGRQLPWGVLLAMTIVTTAAFAFASWHLVEKRALQFKPRRVEAPAGGALPSWLAWIRRAGARS